MRLNLLNLFNYVRIVHYVCFLLAAEFVFSAVSEALDIGAVHINEQDTCAEHQSRMYQRSFDAHVIHEHVHAECDYRIYRCREYGTEGDISGYSNHDYEKRYYYAECNRVDDQQDRA